PGGQPLRPARRRGVPTPPARPVEARLSARAKAETEHLPRRSPQAKLPLTKPESKWAEHSAHWLNSVHARRSAVRVLTLNLSPRVYRPANPMVGNFYLGRYEALRLLGEGGMGRVYLARQADLAGRQVVVKVMHDHIASDPKFSERFEREIQTMARFQHPYAVNLYDASGNDQPVKCIIMEYIRGITLEELLQQEGRLHPARVGRMLGQICEVLQAAHQQGIIHRDLKPANLMVVDAGTPYEKIKVMDFGLATLVRLETISDAHGDYAVGTPNYMCPEQAQGAELDHRSDLYSLGVI